jgi:ethanolaminephosphotransferase
MFAAAATFYLTTWEEYHTGTLYLGVVSGPVEGVLMLCGIFAFTAVKGGAFWGLPLFEVLGLEKATWAPEIVAKLPIKYWYFVFGAVMLGVNIIQSCINVINVRRSKKLSVFPALAGLLPFVGFATLIPTWLYLRPVILEQHLLPFIFFFGLCFAYQVGLIITAHLTKSAYPFSNILLLPIAFGAFDALGPFVKEKSAGIIGWPSVLGGGQYEVAYVFACLGLGVGVYGSFVVDVITNICDFLDIWCLTIKHKQPREGEVKVQKSQ